MNYLLFIDLKVNFDTIANTGLTKKDSLVLNSGNSVNPAEKKGEASIINLKSDQKFKRFLKVFIVLKQKWAFGNLSFLIFLLWYFSVLISPICSKIK